MRLKRGLKVVAVFEAGKGLLVLLAGFGLLTLLHRDLQHIAEQLVRLSHLNPASHYPRIFIDMAARTTDQRLWALAGMAFAYALVRLVEGYGLWRGRRWAEWFAAIAGGIYVPMELAELWAHPTALKALALVANVAVVAFMLWSLWRSRRAGAS
ncbi:MAG: DUF2127 domain-containing protein [Pseudomonadota bacterium]